MKKSLLSKAMETIAATPTHPAPLSSASEPIILSGNMIEFGMSFAEPGQNGFVIKRADNSFVTLTGLTEAEVKAVAPQFMEDVSIAVTAAALATQAAQGVEQGLVIQAKAAAFGAAEEAAKLAGFSSVIAAIMAGGEWRKAQEAAQGVAAEPVRQFDIEDIIKKAVPDTLTEMAKRDLLNGDPIMLYPAGIERLVNLFAAAPALAQPSGAIPEGWSITATAHTGTYQIEHLPTGFVTFVELDDVDPTDHIFAMLARDLLAAPAASVPADRDAIIEQCAKACEDAYAHDTGVCAAQVRALKDKPSEPAAIDGHFIASAEQWTKLYEHCGIDPEEYEGAGPIIEFIDAIRALKGKPAAPAAKPVHEQNARFAIEGAMTHGYLGENEPPSGEWLLPFWNMGAKLRAYDEAHGIVNAWNFGTPPVATAAPLTVPQELREIGRLIATQDNRYTDQPMFTVQQKRRTIGFDPAFLEPEQIGWFDTEGYMADAEEGARLEAEYQKDGKEPEGWTRTGYSEHWEFVTACFTEHGCKDYLAKDGHNLKEPRIYADGSYRNSEYRAVRNWLLSLVAAPDAAAIAPPAEQVQQSGWALPEPQRHALWNAITALRGADTVTKNVCGADAIRILQKMYDATNDAPPAPGEKADDGEQQ